jgi:hypothetical protein
MTLPIRIQTTRLDAGQTVFLEQELEALMVKVYQAILPQLKAMRIFPVRTDFNEWAETIAYTMLTHVGSAAVLRLPSSEIPRVDLYREKFRSTVREIAAKYGWTIIELEQAAMAKVALDRELTNAAIRAIAQKVQEVLLNGHAATQVPGLLTNPNIPRASVPNGSGGSPLWSVKNADEILLDMNNCANNVVTNSLEAFQPDTLVMGLTNFHRITTLPRSSLSDETVYSYFLRTNPYIKRIESLREFDTAGTGGVRIMCAFQSNPDYGAYALVRPMEQRPNQEKDLRVDVNCFERTGGYIVPEPLAYNFSEGM